MLVVKFGGTSVGSAEAIEKVIGILNNGEHRSRTRVAVVSALSGITDMLIEVSRLAVSGEGSYKTLIGKIRKRHEALAAAFLKGSALEKAKANLEERLSELTRILDSAAVLRELSPRTLDLIMSFGERLSAELIAGIFTAKGMSAAFLDTRPIVKTDNNFGKAVFLPKETYDAIRSHFKTLGAESKKGNIPLQVATGFIGSARDNSVTTLGRGGSDLTAAIFAAALDAEELEIWTDVDGILTTDPRQVLNAFRIKNISYVEAMELSHFGAKVIYPPCIRPALEMKIPIRIKNTFNPSCPGTAIVMESSEDEYPVRGISSISDIVLLNIEGSAMVGVTSFPARLFNALARRKINIILITQSSSKYSLCLAVLPSDADAAKEVCLEEFELEIKEGTIEEPVIERNLSIIAVVGAKMKSIPGISGKFFHALGRNGINIVAISQGSSETNISAVINKADERKALNAVHEAYFLSGVRSVNLFLIGTGLIGKTLLEQIASHREILDEEYKIRVNLVGLADSKTMIFKPEGLEPKNARALLKGEIKDPQKLIREPMTLESFVSAMKAMNMPNTCFCDCTASDDVAGLYADILRSSIPVVTPNKRAGASPLAYYKTITGFSRSRNIPYIYDTTVCAGLPVISTIRDLFLSGDKVKRIEAVLSGTLSFIFNSYDGSKPFSALVREAKEKGYTEPDPRDDLNAMDAARKALILARECGMPLEFASVGIEPILPAACFEAASVDAFFKELQKADKDFERRRADAAAEGKVLRYIAVIEEGSARLALRAEGEGSPFLSLTDADNIVVIRSDRYSKLPLVIKGPGAGAQVTAGRVFENIARIARTLV